MAAPGPDIVRLSRAYAYNLEKNRGDVQAAVRAISPPHLPSTYGDRRSAIYYAQRAMVVGQRLREMDAEDILRSALREWRRPAQTVGVRVRVTRHQVRRGSLVQDERDTLYIEADWNDTLQSVLERAHAWAESTKPKSGDYEYAEVEFYGPTLLPGSTKGLEIGG